MLSPVVKVAVMVWAPDDCGHTLTVHVAASDPLSPKVHVPNRSPPGEELNTTVPPGLDFVPASVSVTVTFSVLACAINTVLGPGLKVTPVVVVRSVTVSAKGVALLLLPAWIESVAV
jgi:hypothetical protein